MAEKYCKKCGYGNPEERGACLMCYAYLDEVATGVPCPNCGADNPKDAAFCSACGTQISTEVLATPPIALLAAAEAIWEAAGGEVGEYEEEDEYAPEEMSDEDREAFEEFQRQQAEIRGEAIPPTDEDEEFQPVMAATIDDESEAAIAMSGIAEAFEEEELAMDESLSMDEGIAVEEEEPAMDDSLAIDEDLSIEEEPPAPAASASAEDIAVDEDAELTEEDLAMPVPGDLPDFDEAIAEPIFEEEAEEEAPEEPEEEEAPAAEESGEDEEDLGGWALAFDEEEE